MNEYKRSFDHIGSKQQIMEKHNHNHFNTLPIFLFDQKLNGFHQNHHTLLKKSAKLEHLPNTSNSSYSNFTP